jgi:hypothetical protein
MHVNAFQDGEAFDCVHFGNLWHSPWRLQLEYMMEGLRKVGRFTCVDVCGSHDASLHGLNRLIAALARGDSRVPYRFVHAVAPYMLLPPPPPSCAYTHQDLHSP